MRHRDVYDVFNTIVEKYYSVRYCKIYISVYCEY